MPNATEMDVGSVGYLWRYPIKSMMGEELNAIAVTERGLLGDRAYALMDPSTGKVASAEKHLKRHYRRPGSGAKSCRRRGQESGGVADSQCNSRRDFDQASPTAAVLALAPWCVSHAQIFS